MPSSPSRPRTFLRRLAVVGGLFAGLASASHAVTFAEVGDAGQFIGTAQYTTGGGGALTTISGTLNSLYDVDLFVINITNPGSFSATTVGTGSLDTQIFVLTLAGAPVILNDDDQGGLVLQSTLPAGSFKLAAGNYIIGVSEAGNMPVNSANQKLFAMSPATTDVLGPAFGLQPAALSGYSQENSYPEMGAYALQLTGAAVAAVPEPSTYALMLLGLGALGFAARRRRSA